MELEQKIEFSVDCSYSKILDQASEVLKITRSERKTNMEKLEYVLTQIFTRFFRAGGVDRPLVTKRISRMCISIRTTHRSLLPNGIVLDSSSSGATYFMEQREAVDLNNLEVRLSKSKKMEEQAILSLLSAEVAEFSRQIRHLLDRVLKWIFLVQEMVMLGGWKRSVQISVPEMGITSTIPYQWMTKHRRTNPFNLYTSWIWKILKVASERSLVLLDEIESGIDPSEGVALSASILQYLKDSVNLAVVTTPYADLTRLKEKDARFENAAMEFSLESLQPTYRILWGSMGESNASSIAKTIGFDGKIIEQAQSWVEKLTPEKTQKLNSLLYRSLVEERRKLEVQA
ncbi:hypothetical protein OROGR_001081 [Orobanche gracilis]